MKCTGTLTDLGFDLTGRLKVTMTLEANPEDLEKLKDKRLSVEVTQFRNRRSQEANSYFHVLVDKLADALRISKNYCKNMMIASYGQKLYLDEDKTQEAVIKTNVPVDQMLESDAVHCWPCKFDEANGKEIVFYRIYRGSHTYDTREMSILIDGVVQECKTQGIETMTPNEIKEMLAQYEKKHNAGESEDLLLVRA